MVREQERLGRERLSLGLFMVLMGKRKLILVGVFLSLKLKTVII